MIENSARINARDHPVGSLASTHGLNLGSSHAALIITRLRGIRFFECEGCKRAVVFLYPDHGLRCARCARLRFQCRHGAGRRPEAKVARLQKLLANEKLGPAQRLRYSQRLARAQAELARAITAVAPQIERRIRSNVRKGKRGWTARAREIGLL